MERMLMGPEHLVMHQLNMSCDPAYRFNHDNPPLAAPREKLRPSPSDEGTFNCPVQTSKSFYDVDTSPPVIPLSTKPKELDSCDFTLRYLQENKERREAERRDFLTNALTCAEVTFAPRNTPYIPAPESIYEPLNIAERVAQIGRFSEPDPVLDPPRPFKLQTFEPTYEPPNLAERVGRIGRFSEPDPVLDPPIHVKMQTFESIYEPPNIAERVARIGRYSEPDPVLDPPIHVKMQTFESIYEPPNIAERVAKIGRYSEPDPVLDPPSYIKMQAYEIPLHVQETHQALFHVDIPLDLPPKPIFVPRIEPDPVFELPKPFVTRLEPAPVFKAPESIYEPLNIAERVAQIGRFSEPDPVLDPPSYVKMQAYEMLLHIQKNRQASFHVDIPLDLSHLLPK